MAMAMTVPDLLLKTSWLIITTGLNPACSWPFVGFKSAQYMSPLNILAIQIDPLIILHLLTIVHKQGRVLQIPRPIVTFLL